MKLVLILSIFFIFNLSSQQKSHSFNVIEQSQKHAGRPYFNKDRMIHLFLEQIKNQSEKNIKNNVCFVSMDLSLNKISPVTVRFKYDEFIKLAESLKILEKVNEGDFKFKQNQKAFISPGIDFLISLTFDQNGHKVFKLTMGDTTTFNVEMNEESYKNFVLSCIKVKDLIEKEK